MDYLAAELVTGLGDLREVLRSLLRLVVALLCGAVIGYQRERVGKAAGLRTHILVAAGSALVVSAAVEAGMDTDSISPVIQGLVTGIGFLGAGAILKQEQERSILGLTTAAGIWMTSAIGITAGLGRFGTALAATLLAWCVLSALYRLEHAEHAPDEEWTRRMAAARSRRLRLERQRRKESTMKKPAPKQTDCTTDVSEPKPEAPHVEDLIDESMEESFPASDPPAVTPKKDPAVPPEPPSPTPDRPEKRPPD